MSVALITGGARGIGFGIAQALAGEGFDLALCGRRAPSATVREIEKLRNCGVRVMYSQADVASASARADLVEAVRDEFGRLDVLVNNAGIAPARRGDMLELSSAEFEDNLSTNLTGPFFLTQLCARWMVEMPLGEFRCIVNISSVSATVVSTSRAEYCVAKAGVSMATRLWAARLAEHNVCVYEVRPGIVRTDMTAPAEEHYSRLLDDGIAVQRRWGSAGDVGRAVAALARGDFAYSTGQVFHVDGGLTVQRL